MIKLHVGVHVISWEGITLQWANRVLSDCRLALSLVRSRCALRKEQTASRSRHFLSAIFLLASATLQKIHARTMSYTTALAQWTGSQVCCTLGLERSCSVSNQSLCTSSFSLQCAHSLKQPSRSQVHNLPRKALLQAPQTTCRKANLRQHVPHATGTQV